MKRFFFILAGLLCALFGNGALANPLDTFSERGQTSANHHLLSETFGKLPLLFEARQGQNGKPERFLSRGEGHSWHLTSAEAVLVLNQDAINGTPDPITIPTAMHMRMLGANPLARMNGEKKLAGKTNYLIGNRPDRWQTGIANFGQVRVHDIYPEIDLVYYGNQRQLKYDFLVAPGANPEKIQLSFQGVEDIHIDDEGNLVLETVDAEVIQQAPFIYQEIDGQKQAVEGRYVLLADHQVGFNIAAYDPGKTLVIDPIISYSTYLGGSGNEQAFSIAVDSVGGTYVAGWTDSTDFPNQSSVQSVPSGEFTAFVTKLSPDGSTFEYSTYLGGSGWEQITGITVDGSGNAYVMGDTSSTDFPMVNAPQNTYAGGSMDAFVAKLNVTGDSLIYSTFLGGSGTEDSAGIALDASGNAYVTGTTRSTDFPTVNAVQSSNAGSQDAYLTKLNADGSAFVYSTYFGGSLEDKGFSIAVDGSGNAYVTGKTKSTDLTTVNPFQSTKGNPASFSSADGFVAKLSLNGSALEYSTYLGGSLDDFGVGIAVDASGNAYVTGETDSTDFPTASPLQTSNAGGMDGFVTKLNSTGNSLVYSTYLGGNLDDIGAAIALDGIGNAYVTGKTNSTDFLALSPTQNLNGGGRDAFVTALTADGSALAFSTYLGGSGTDQGSGIAVDTAANIYVTGWSFSSDYPTLNPVQANTGDTINAFLAKFGNNVIDSIPEGGGEFELYVKNAKVKASEKGKLKIKGSLGYEDKSKTFDLLDKEVVVMFDKYSQTIPAGSFILDEDDEGEFKFNKKSSVGITQIKIKKDGRFKIKFHHTNLSEVSLDSPVKFSLKIGDDAGETEIPFDHRGKFKATANEKEEFKEAHLKKKKHEDEEHEND